MARSPRSHPAKPPWCLSPSSPGWALPCMEPGATTWVSSGRAGSATSLAAPAEMAAAETTSLREQLRQLPGFLQHSVLSPPHADSCSPSLLGCSPLHLLTAGAWVPSSLCIWPHCGPLFPEAPHGRHRRVLSVAEDSCSYLAVPFTYLPLPVPPTRWERREVCRKNNKRMRVRRTKKGKGLHVTSCPGTERVKNLGRGKGRLQVVRCVVLAFIS